MSCANRLAENDQTARHDFGCSFRSQAGRGFGDPGAGYEPQALLVQVVEIGGRQHADVGDHGLDPVPGLELPDDRQDRVLFGLVPLEAADLEGNPFRPESSPATTCGPALRSFE